MKVMNLRIRLFWALLIFWSLSWAQPSAPPENWHHLNQAKDGYPGVNSEKLYTDLIKDAKGETVIVAVIDGGVDYTHEDLKEVMWVNEDEIPGNGIDDDKNGYVDDIHGWNFIGGKKGENVHHDNLEVTRLYKEYKGKFEDADVSKLSKKEKVQYEQWKEYETEVSEKREEMGQEAAFYGGIFEAFKALEKAIGKEEITVEDLENFQSDDPMLSRTAMVAINAMSSQGGSFSALLDDLEEAYDHFDSQLKYYYNPEFECRGIVGDHYEDPYERHYGNSDVKGPDAFHGTFVAGLIGAERNNDLGIDGIANDVRIMALRVVPDGDERDKDVANAIIYAVDNGAKVINMSFGKGYSPYKPAVDKAVKYARKKDVVLVHAAGNDGKENTNFNNFPNDRFEKKGLFGPQFADNWIEVGASTAQEGENLAADFSNYSAQHVDIFAPGAEVYSTDIDDKYKRSQGTSFSAPIVAGVAALLRSYFPDLTAEQVKAVILSSSSTPDLRVIKPGSDEKIAFSKLSLSGGLLDAYGAVRMAAETKGKNKRAGRYLGPYSTVSKGKAGDVVVP